MTRHVPHFVQEMPDVLTTLGPNNRIVLAKVYKDEIVTMKYSNRSQAKQKAMALNFVAQPGIQQGHGQAVLRGLDPSLQGASMMIEYELDEPLLSRWKAYQEEAPRWSLLELISQLLRQHFDEADAMRESIAEQERKRRR